MSRVFGKLLLAAAALACGSTAMAQTGPTIKVTPYLAVNAFGSPSYAAEISNQNSALYKGQSSAGTAGTPSYYQAQSNIFTTDLLVTNFASYRGSADPAATYGSAYANELGTRGAFGVFVNGNGTQFSISQLSFSAVGTGNAGALTAYGNYSDTHYLDFANPTGSYNYGNGYEGILVGNDGILGTSDDVFVTSGANTQMVDALVGRGSANAYSVLCGTDPDADFGPCGAGNQSYIDEAAAGFPFPGTYTGTYSLGGVSGSGSFSVTTAPEPATWAMMLVGFGMVGVGLRRAARRSDEKFDLKIKRIAAV